MDAYFDSSLLVATYVAEPGSPLVAPLVQSEVPIAVNGMHLAEVQNALQLKLFRGTAHEAEIRRAMGLWQRDLQEGVLGMTEPDWPGVFAQAAELARRHTAKTGARTLDLLHVAAARAAGCGRFFTGDERQAKVARAEGLTVKWVR